MIWLLFLITHINRSDGQRSLLEWGGRAQRGERGVQKLSRSRFVWPCFGYHNPLLSSLLKTVGVVLGFSEGESWSCKYTYPLWFQIYAARAKSWGGLCVQVQNSTCFAKRRAMIIDNKRPWPLFWMFFFFPEFKLLFLQNVWKKELFVTHSEACLSSLLTVSVCGARTVRLTHLIHWKSKHTNL